MKTLLDERLWAVLIAIGVLAIWFWSQSLVVSAISLAVLATVFASLVAPWLKKQQEQLELAAQEAAKKRQAKAEARKRRDSLFELMQDQRNQNNQFFSILHQNAPMGMWRNGRIGRSPAFCYGTNQRFLTLDWSFVGYYLWENRLRQWEIKDFASLIGQEVPEVMVIEVSWTDYEEEEVPGENIWIAKSQGVARHEKYLYWNSLPKWYCLSWGEEEVAIQDLFGKTITLPAEGEMVSKVLEFVTSHDSVEGYALKAIATHAVPSLLKASANRWLKLIRIALSLGIEALGGRLLTEERWADLVNHDPAKF